MEWIEFPRSYPHVSSLRDLETHENDRYPPIIAEVGLFRTKNQFFSRLKLTKLAVDVQKQSYLTETIAIWKITFSGFLHGLYVRRIDSRKLGGVARLVLLPRDEKIEISILRTQMYLFSRAIMSVCDVTICKCCETRHFPMSHGDENDTIAFLGNFPTR